MRAIAYLILMLLAGSGSALAAGQVVPPSPAAPVPIFILAPEGQSTPSPSTQTAQAPAAEPVVDDTPYNGLFQRSPLMKYLAWYCAIMAPIAFILLTGLTLIEFQKRRSLAVK